MPLYRATRKSDGHVVEYEADAPEAEHLTDAWRVERMETAYVAPDAPPPEPVLLPITRLAFRNRFTQAEKVAIEIAALDDPSQSMQQRAMAAALRASQADILAAQYIDLKRADTRAGVQSLEAAGLLAPGRADQILNTPAERHEVWNGQ